MRKKPFSSLVTRSLRDVLVMVALEMVKCVTLSFIYPCSHWAFTLAAVQQVINNIKPYRLIVCSMFQFKTMDDNKWLRFAPAFFEMEFVSAIN
jgi:hypothetical protein